MQLFQLGAQLGSIEIVVGAARFSIRLGMNDRAL
jgi:hypothetical protein